METPDACPFRYIYKGRTFCAIAIRERRYTTSEVVPSACGECNARELLARVHCRHMNLGVEVDQYGGSHAVNIFYVSCERLIERITQFDRCGEGRCELWEPFDEDAAEAARNEALADLRAREHRPPE